MSHTSRVEPAATPAIVWFRQDLRVADNPALTVGALGERPVIPLYIHDEGSASRPLGGASQWWLDKSLASLAADLSRLGSPLVLRRGPTEQVLNDVVAETGARGIYWNRLYDAASMSRDKRLKADLRAAGIECGSFNAALLNEPWEVKTGTGGAYRVFTPYWRSARATPGNRAPCPAPVRLTPPKKTPVSNRLADWRLHPSAPDWSSGFSEWAPGEAGALARLDDFLGGAARDYGRGRNRPGLAGTSALSPHLAFGEIGPRQVWSAAEAAAHRAAAPEREIDTFLKELGWREFNYHLLFHHPEITMENFNRAFDGFAWRDDRPALEAWRRGRTGFPIVDAGMRQLWATGWMHNRVRMIAASFLIKDLMIDWREGEAWFWDTLVDADLANNVANWQWVAGCGADAAPYFRIFNPILQGETFDPAGDYVRRWTPELAGLPDAFVHRPWRADADTLAAGGVNLGETYPAPIVDHAAARLRALAAYRNLAAYQEPT